MPARRSPSPFLPLQREAEGVAADPTGFVLQVRSDLLVPGCSQTPSFPRVAGASGWSLLRLCLGRGMRVMSTFHSQTGFSACICDSLQSPEGPWQGRGGDQLQLTMETSAVVHSSRSLPRFLRNPQPVYEEMDALRP